jgi:hypothetical protein
MQRPQTPGAGDMGAVRFAFGSDRTTHPLRPPAPAVQRLRRSMPLQQAFRRLHRCGEQPCAMFVAELLDAIGADPTAIDLILTWVRLEPDVVRALASDFPPPPLDEVA